MFDFINFPRINKLIIINASDYAVYADVFPDENTIANHHSQSLQMEQHAAQALKKKTDSQKAVLHFDTTKRS